MEDFDPGRFFPDFGTAFGGDSSDDEGFRSRFSRLFSPVEPYNRWPVLVPFVSVIGAASIFVLTGVAAAAFVVMSFALLVVMFLLTEVFGFELQMPVMPMPR